MQSIKNQPTEKEIYIWNITGSMANALLSVVALMLVTRMLNKEDTDIFSIAWSISQLMVTIGTFQIRVYQATDVKQTFQFKQYCVFRFLTVVAMLISSAVYIELWIQLLTCMKAGFSKKRDWTWRVRRLHTELSFQVLCLV